MEGKKLKEIQQEIYKILLRASGGIKSGSESKIVYKRKEILSIVNAGRNIKIKDLILDLMA